MASGANGTVGDGASELCDIEAECSVLGAVMRDNAWALRLDLRADDFAAEHHRRLWSIARRQASVGKPFTVAAAIADQPALAALIEAMRDLPGLPEDIKRQAATVGEMATRRRIRYLARDLAVDAGDFERSPDDLVARSVRELSGLAVSATARTKREALGRVLAALDRGSLPCDPTGLPKLDDAIGGGLFRGKTYGIAARKKVGKTVLLGTISHNLNAREVPHLFIAQETSDEEIEGRSLARVLKIRAQKLLEPGETWSPQLKAAAAKYHSNVPDFTIYEHAPGATLDDVLRMIAQAVTQQRIAGVILDYWQLVGGKAKNETEEYHLRQVAQSIADMARREGIWALIAAQVNQEGNTRGGEGLRIASDCYLTMHREKGKNATWLAMDEARYCEYCDVGSANDPGLMFHEQGPYFSDPNQDQERML